MSSSLGQYQNILEYLRACIDWFETQVIYQKLSGQKVLYIFEKQLIGSIELI